VSVVKELIETRKTAKQVTGFKGRSGRTFRAKLALEQGDDGKWRVEFDEEWARQPKGEAPAETDAQASESGESEADGTNGRPAAARRPRRPAKAAKE
jgi:DNA topoisomerase-3